MRKIRSLFILLATIVAATAFVPAVAQLHTNDDAHGTHHFAHIADLPHEHLALADMHAYATHHLGEVTELPDTYGEADHWAHDWELRWIDYEVSGHVVRVYHAINKHDHDVRFASSWDIHQERYHDWVEIH